MPDLQLAPERSGSPIKAIIIAVIVLTLVALAVYFFNPRKTADLTVTHTELFTPKVQTTSLFPSSGIKVISPDNSGGEVSTYVVATLKLDNKLRLPIYFVGVEATADLATGEHIAATVLGSLSDVSNVQLAFPALHPLLPHPLMDEDEAAPGQTLQGQVILLFPNMTPEQWKAKRAANLTLNLAHQNPLHVPIP
ncbi:MAG: hypothetical protein PW792_04070 [Acidobacteriaceae bacterium]|nr:hypothetical protein [Acidobacteriaceae bacterium]